MKKYSIIIFDFDGTLVDSRRGVINSFRYSLGKLGLEIKDEKESEKFIGPPLKSVFMDFFSMNDTDAEKGVEYYREYYGEKGVYEAELYDGIRPLLSELFEKKKMMLIATTKAEYYMEIIAEHLGINRFFVNSVGSNLDGTLSDKSELIMHALESIEDNILGKTVMVGDRMFDIKGARNNGIDSIAVTYGYGSMEELLNSGPDYIVKSVDKLREILIV